jgi:hypothetical protein
MKLLYVLIPSLALIACASQQGEDSQPPAAQQINADPLPDTDGAREPSRIHTYLVNDYIDPNNPRLRHCRQIRARIG